MVCPKCKGANLRVIDSRWRKRERYRRYQCRNESCGHRFSTSEQYRSTSRMLERVRALQFEINQAINKLLSNGNP